jgi:hypothetical protein
MIAPFPHDWLERKPYSELAVGLRRALARCRAWPAPEQYDELAALVPRALDVALPRFVTQSRVAVEGAGGYEPHVAQLSAVPTRPGHWHDLFNMIVWAHFPKLRWALNRLHVDPEIGPKDPRNGRAPAQNLAATFDETGVLIVSSSQSVLDDLRGLLFKRVFWDRREELLATTRFWVIGHGLLESLLDPPPGLAARALLVHRPLLAPDETSDALRHELDALVAGRIPGWRTSRSVLDPLPVLAIPGYACNDFAEFYEDRRQIRFEPRSRRPPDAPT